MAPPNDRKAADVRRDLESERERLARSVEELRAGIGQATNIGAMVRARLPLVAAGALGAGFFLAGGVGATARLLMRRSRDR